MAEAEDIARAAVTDIDAEAIAEDVEQVVLGLGLDDLLLVGLSPEAVRKRRRRLGYNIDGRCKNLIFRNVEDAAGSFAAMLRSASLMAAGELTESISVSSDNWSRM